MTKPLIRYCLAGLVIVAAVVVTWFLLQPSSPLVGNWEYSFLDVRGRSPAEKNPVDDESSEPRQILNPNYVRIRFFSDGTMMTDTHTPMGGGVHCGTWDTVASKHNRPIEIECGYKGDKIRIDIDWVDDDTMRMIPPNLFAIKDRFRETPTFHRFNDD
jgi:hypothetical protein